MLMQVGTNFTAQGRSLCGDFGRLVHHERDHGRAPSHLTKGEQEQLLFLLAVV